MHEELVTSKHRGVMLEIFSVLAESFKDWSLTPKYPCKKHFLNTYLTTTSVTSASWQWSTAAATVPHLLGSVPCVSWSGHLQHLHSTEHLISPLVKSRKFSHKAQPTRTQRKIILSKGLVDRFIVMWLPYEQPFIFQRNLIAFKMESLDRNVLY